eukprot:Skav234656  [mRNA]  locus=scaffold1131:213221:214282:- [translate_table: standard]
MSRLHQRCFFLAIVTAAVLGIMLGPDLPLSLGINVKHSQSEQVMVLNASMPLAVSNTSKQVASSKKEKKHQTHPDQFCMDRGKYAYYQTLTENRTRCAGQNTGIYTHHQDLSIPPKVGLNLPTKLQDSCLKFIHIPKAAGTSIEMLGNWGRCDSNLTCSGRKKTKIFRLHADVCSPLKDGDNATCVLWHTPPSDDPLLAQSYSCCKTFCVVRHPVDRWISEYKFYLSYRARPQGQDPCSWQKLKSYSEELLEMYAHKEIDYFRDCHLLPQSRYVISNDGKRLHCDHVIRYENLTDEFNALMTAYGFPQRLTRDKEAAELSLDSHCTINISETMKQWIYSRYYRDFELFGYDRD